MFQFPRFASLKLCVHLRVPQHYLRWVAPFGDLRVNACLRLTVAFRRLPRPSSAPGAKASALRPLYLDLTKVVVTLACQSYLIRCAVFKVQY